MNLTDAEIERYGIYLLLFHAVIITAEVALLFESHKRRGNGTEGQISTTTGSLQTPLF
jgi:hypothetical protein